MSLRTRLIIAFLLLSVVPLSAVTFLSYTSSVRAFEQAAQREATESATDVSRRMEMVTADVGRRMDRLFVAGTASPERPFNPDPQTVRESVAPLLGDTAALVDRVEFHPAPDVPPPPTPAVVTDSVPIPIPPSTPRRGGPGRGGADGPPRDRRRGPPPPGSEVIVMDIPRIVEEATRAAAAAGVAAGGPEDWPAGREAHRTAARGQPGQPDKDGRDIDARGGGARRQLTRPGRRAGPQRRSRGAEGRARDRPRECDAQHGSHAEDGARLRASGPGRDLVRHRSNRRALHVRVERQAAPPGAWRRAHGTRRGRRNSAPNR